MPTTPNSPIYLATSKAKKAERNLINKHLYPLSLGSSYALKLEDDISITPIQSTEDGYTHITSTDTLQEGIHCKPNSPLHEMSHKLLARNLSDIASKGATPTGYLLSIIASRTGSLDTSIPQIAKGLLQLTKQFSVPLLGGDMSRGTQENFIFSITVFGKTNTPIPLRSNAQLGDAIYCSGECGAAYHGFTGSQKYEAHYTTPTPTVNTALKIAPHATAMTDSSDGIFDDLLNLLTASNLSANIDFSQIPIAHDASTTPSPENLAKILSFGDDYNLIFTSPIPNLETKVPNSKIFRIGATTPNTHSEPTITFTNAPKNLAEMLQAQPGHTYF